MRERFAFLANWGFEVESVHERAVVWRAADRRITVARDWRDGFVDVTFARGEPGAFVDRFGLHEGLEAVGKGELWPAHGWQGYDPTVARSYVDELASLTSAVAPELLGLGSAGWERAAARSRELSHEYTRDLADSRTRRAAEAAWHARDWTAVVKHYVALEAGGASLAPSELKRLAYARKRL
ncbi:MAG TPA: hypothetical protein VGX28_03890 [Frankiaceae bacterium]|jgi:hypothetical protein|nr:hypothetical protein [Frankiaceae bacterium]